MLNVTECARQLQDLLGRRVRKNIIALFCLFPVFFPHVAISHGTNHVHSI
jgi:hypothetical protein